MEAVGLELLGYCMWPVLHLEYEKMADLTLTCNHVYVYNFLIALEYFFSKLI